MGLGDVGPGQDADVELGLRLAPFAPDGLAPIGRQGGQEVVEGLIALVAPDELDVAARQQACLGHGAPFRLGREVNVQGRDAEALDEGQCALQ
ncbi:hypothetical protein D3C81_1700490 [compost metagenome]